MSEVTPIDSSKVEVRITEVDVTDRRLDVEVPAELVTLFLDNLEISKVQLDARGLQKLMLDFCRNEGASRLDGEPIFENVLVPGQTIQVPQKGKPFCMSFFCDIPPEVDWPDFSTISIVRPVRELTEEMVEAELTNQCLEAGERSVHDGALEVLDEVEGSFRLLDHESGEELLAVDPITLRLVAAGTPVMISGLIFNDVPEAIVGRSMGDTVTLETVIPMGFTVSSMRGAPVTMEIFLRKAWRTSPATVEDVLAQYGTPNEIVLREQIRFSLRERIDNDQLTAMTQQLFEALYKNVTIPIPNRIHEMMNKRTTALHKEKLEQTGRSSEEIESILRGNNDALEQETSRRLSKAICLHVLSQKLSVGFNEQDLTERIGVMAATRGCRPEELRRQVVDNADQLGPIREDIMTRKITQALVDQITITDMHADEWNKAGAGVGVRSSGE